ncbi:MAG: 1-acyl-sn-glycerol-3-phosphate acyltransferase [Bacteroidetes bacterium]|nr:MAG: 1-acyl-sn-glycerol-3-phosphate acyltransferase [Bacteroidota bacterium]TAG94502.1 MAG: 1-acyl-sn-glycerol-3-phosphate acyltransferase [Bacteroidota bacterium]
MKKILSWLVTPLFLIVFGLLLLIFQPLMWISHRVFGLKTLESVTYCLQALLIDIFILTGSWFKVTNPYKDRFKNINRPLIIISNHQSMFDIPLILWYFRKNRPKFVAKREVGKGIPSISYYLHHGEHMLIDRKDKEQALSAIERGSPMIAKNNWSAAIFPEGTRSKDGITKPFKTAGITKLLEMLPNALVVPVVVGNTWLLGKYNYLPVPFNARYSFEVLEPIEPNTMPVEDLIVLLEQKIRSLVEKKQGK